MREPLFIMECTVEALLAFETRRITMPDGVARQCTAMRLHWHSYDFVVRTGLFTENQLIEFADRISRKKGYPFEGGFRCIVSHVHEKLLRTNFLRDVTVTNAPWGLPLEVGGQVIGFV